MFVYVFDIYSKMQLCNYHVYFWDTFFYSPEAPKYKHPCSYCLIQFSFEVVTEQKFTVV